MLSEFRGLIELIGQYAYDLTQADIERAEIKVTAAKADLERLKKRQQAGRTLLRKYVESVEQEKKAAKQAQEKWQREMKKRGPWPVPPIPVGATEIFAEAVPQKRRRAAKPKPAA
jgi:hypothetical protein